MEVYQIVLVPIAFGLLGFVEPCSIGANIIFLGYLQVTQGRQNLGGHQIHHHPSALSGSHWSTCGSGRPADENRNLFLFASPWTRLCRFGDSGSLVELSGDRSRISRSRKISPHRRGVPVRIDFWPNCSGLLSPSLFGAPRARSDRRSLGRLYFPFSLRLGAFRSSRLDCPFGEGRRDLAKLRQESE